MKSIQQTTIPKDKSISTKKACNSFFFKKKFEKRVCIRNVWLLPSFVNDFGYHSILWALWVPRSFFFYFVGKNIKKKKLV